MQKLVRADYFVAAKIGPQTMLWLKIWSRLAKSGLTCLQMALHSWVQCTLYARIYFDMCFGFRHAITPSVTSAKTSLGLQMVQVQ